MFQKRRLQWRDTWNRSFATRCQEYGEFPTWKRKVSAPHQSPSGDLKSPERPERRLGTDPCYGCPRRSRKWLYFQATSTTLERTILALTHFAWAGDRRETLPSRWGTRGTPGTSVAFRVPDDNNIMC